MSDGNGKNLQVVEVRDSRRPLGAFVLAFLVGMGISLATAQPVTPGGGGATISVTTANATTGNFASIDAGTVRITGNLAVTGTAFTLGNASNSSTMNCFSSGGVTGECLAIGAASTFVGSTQHKGIAANGGAETALIFANTNTLASTQDIAQFRNGNSFSATKVFGVRSDGLLYMANADGGSAGNVTVNQPSGKAAIANGAGSMTLTNSLISTSVGIQVTPLTDDACIMYAIPGSGSAEIGCVGATTCSTAAGCNFFFEVRKLQ